METHLGRQYKDRGSDKGPAGVQELPKFLTEEYGIDPQYIDVKTKG